MPDADKQPGEWEDRLELSSLSQEEVRQIMISRGYPMSRRRVAQIEANALAKLRKLLSGWDPGIQD